MARATGLRNLVTFSRRTSLADDFSGEAEAWSALGTAWASIVPATGSESIDSQQVDGTVSHKVTIRYGSTLAGLAPRDRFAYNSKTYQIVSVVNVDAANKWMELMCAEAV